MIMQMICTICKSVLVNWRPVVHELYSGYFRFIAAHKQYKFPAIIAWEKLAKLLLRQHYILVQVTAKKLKWTTQYWLPHMLEQA